MPRVFISHAGDDKPVIEPLVRALIMCGESIFVDKPSDKRWKFKPEEISHLRREGRIDFIENAASWDTALENALRQSTVVLGCLSKNVANDRPILNSELSIAAYDKKLVTCLVKGSDYADLPDNVGLFRAKTAQTDPVDGKIVLAALHKQQARKQLSADEEEELRAFHFLLKEIERVKTRDPPELSNFQGNLKVELESQTFRAGRMPQREDVDCAFDAAREKGVQAIAVSGPQNEYVDQFVEKIVACRRSRNIRNAEQCREITVRLPELKRSKTWDGFARAYGRAIADQLNMPESKLTTYDEIASELAKGGLVVLCKTQPFTWQRLQERRQQVEFWLQYWRRVGNSPAQPKVVTLLRTSFPRAAAGWRQNALPDASAKAFIKWMKKLQSRTERTSGFLGFSAPQLVALDVSDPLAPIERNDALEWASTVCPELSTRGKLDAAIERIYDTEAARNNGLTMEEFHKKAPGAICSELAS